MAIARYISLASLILAMGVLKAPAADEHLPTLKVGPVTYTNVTVTKVTAVDVSFLHARGMGNAKLKDLEPDLQKHFHYDPAKADMARQRQYAANAQYRQMVITNEVRKPTDNSEIPDVYVEVPEVKARRFLGGPPPPGRVEKWLTPEPDNRDKFVLIDFWGTWCGPCRRSIPKLNGFQAAYRDRLVVIGITAEPEEVVRAMTTPKIEYFVAIDSQARMLNDFGVRAIPHAVLIDPKSIVRFEGNPQYLTSEGLEKLMRRYGD